MSRFRQHFKRFKDYLNSKVASICSEPSKSMNPEKEEEQKQMDDCCQKDDLEESVNNLPVRTQIGTPKYQLPRVQRQYQRSSRKSISPVERMSQRRALKRCQSDPGLNHKDRPSSSFESSFGRNSGSWYTTSDDDLYRYKDTSDADLNSDFSEIYDFLSDQIEDEPAASRRDAIIEMLVNLGLVRQEDASIMSEVTIDTLHAHGTPNVSNVILNNLIGFPEDLGFHSCFVDYVNFRCYDAEILERLLKRPISFSINEKDAFARSLDPNTKVFDLIKADKSIFNSFCLGRCVFSEEFRHCPRCRMCVLAKQYSHCDVCNKCSIGLGIGNRCEHCNYTVEVVSEASVASFSELEPYLEE